MDETVEINYEEEFYRLKDYYDKALAQIEEYKEMEIQYKIAMAKLEMIYLIFSSR